MQGPPRGPLHHASHMQSVMFWPPADEFEFSGQRVQFAVPLESLYVPGRQALHWPFKSPVSGPVYPVLHKQSRVSISNRFGLLFQAQQSSDSIVPGSDLNPTGHTLQEDAVETFENVSASHSRHGPALAVGLNEPFGQDTHTELFVPFGAYPKLHVSHESVSEL